ELARHIARPPAVIRLAESRYWRQPVSATFHGRDILAPVAAHLSLGLDPHSLGPDVTDWVRWQAPAPRPGPPPPARAAVCIDQCGNLITNIPGEAFLALASRPVRVTVGSREVPRRVRTYAEAEPGSVVALVSSSGMLEVAVTQGSAADRLQARPGTPVAVE